MQHRFGPTRTALGALIALALALGACGDDGDDDASSDTSMETTTTESMSDDVVEEEDDMSDDDMSDDDGEATAPDERSGTITIADTTQEIADGDFLICETVNPAFEGDFNIITELDGRRFRLDGNVDEIDPELDGLFLGEIPDEERAEDLEVNLDGRTLSGSATVSEGAIEFSFTC